MSTMESIFDKEANQKLLQRIDSLSAAHKAMWGKMNAAQMLLHCQKPMDVGTGQLKLSRGILGMLFGKMAKRGFLKDKGFKQNLPTHPKFRISDTPDFEAEKKAFADKVRLFGDRGPSVLATKKHPFFGEMSHDEWGQLLYLHTNHHLSQFGV